MNKLFVVVAIGLLLYFIAEKFHFGYEVLGIYALGIAATYIADWAASAIDEVFRHE